MSRSFDLVGLDGTNPLGFLAALGTMASLHYAGRGEPRLRWKCTNRWTAVLEAVNVDAKTQDDLVALLVETLRGRTVSKEADERRKCAEQEMQRAKTAIKNKREEIRKRRLRGSQRTEVEERELRPLEREYQEKRRRWLDALREVVPRPELALGKRLDCTPSEYREHVAAVMNSASQASRETLDMYGSFGVDAIRQKNNDSIEPTPFCFIRGSGHQDFLDTARELIARVTEEAVARTLFSVWSYPDQGLSMRWDPIEDRRYALMDRDPTASGNKPRTMWMANLLAYRSLAVFPAAPVGRRLQVSGWDPNHQTFTWPLWEHPLSLDAVRSLVQLRELVKERPNVPALRALGIVAAYRTTRIEVGSGANKKLNFSPARRVV